MTGFDYALVAIVGLSSLLGVWRGVAGEVLGLAAWIAAFFAARAWGQGVGAVLPLPLALNDAAWRQIAGFAAVFVAILLLFALLRLLFSRLLRAVGLGLADRFLGGVFGVARGAALVLALTLVVGLTDLPQQAWWRQASLTPPLETAVLAARPGLPPALAQRIRYR